MDAVVSDKVKNNDFQDARDMVTLSIVSDIQHYDSQLGSFQETCIVAVNRETDGMTTSTGEPVELQVGNKIIIKRWSNWIVFFDK